MHRIGRLHQWIESLIGARALRLVRYLIAGGIAAASNLAILFLLVHLGGMYYIYASILAFILSIAVSFITQKFLTFQDTPLYNVHKQFVRYLVVIFANLILNTLIIYLIVEVAGAWYMLAQVFATATVAVTGYIGYSTFVFRTHNQRPLDDIST